MAINHDQATIQSLCELLSQIFEDAHLDSLLSSLGVQRNRSIFTPALVIWLMIFQRFHPTHTLSRSVAELKSGRLNHLLDDCKRSRSGVISGNTGVYSKARERFPIEAIETNALTLFYENNSEKLLSFLDDFQYYKLYRAKHKPSEPRALKPPKRKFPLLLVPRKVARSRLHSKNSMALRTRGGVGGEG